MKRALISVSDKTGIIDFAQKLIACGYEIISTGGTKSALEESGVKCLGISEITGFPEILDGRVKTLHPNVHGGLLAKRSDAGHRQEVKDNKIEYIDMVVVNLYPFKKTIEKPNVEVCEAIENIDIGGPSMLRSAAKNHDDVTVVCSPSDYHVIIQEIKNNGNTTLETRRKLAAKVFRHTAAYDAVIAKYLTDLYCDNSDIDSLTMTFDIKSGLRYGENPHQKAAFYKACDNASYSLINSKQCHGKELSYNNIQDANACLNIIREYHDCTAAVAVKHMNPCGVGTGSSVFEAFTKCYDSDPVSIFGGIVAINAEVDKATAEKLSKIFLEIVIAPSFSVEAMEILTKKKDLRILTCDFSTTKTDPQKFVSVNGGILMQDNDTYSLSENDLKFVTKKLPTASEITDMLFLWKTVKHVKSNAIVVGKNGQTLGVGAGQMNRVASAEIALKQASGKSESLVLASDAFFPFDDVVRLAKKYNVTAIIQTGGSIRDKDSIAACDELEIAMVFTGIRHFLH